MPCNRLERVALFSCRYSLNAYFLALPIIGRPTREYCMPTGSVKWFNGERALVSSNRMRAGPTYLFTSLLCSGQEYPT